VRDRVAESTKVLTGMDATTANPVPTTAEELPPPPSPELGDPGDPHPDEPGAPEDAPAIRRLLADH
jgi:hypothetical protein